jgi:hypothetical protein
MHLFIALFLGLHLFGALMLLLNASLFVNEAFPSLLSVPKKFSWGKKLHYNTNQVGEVFQPS